MAQLTDVVSLARAKAWFSIGPGDGSLDAPIEAAISAASAWLDDRSGPIIYRTVDGIVVGRYATTVAAQGTRFEIAAIMFVAWLLRTQVLRVAQVDGYDVPAFTGAGDSPVDAIRVLLGDEWIDDEPGDGERESLVGVIVHAPWSVP